MSNTAKRGNLQAKFAVKDFCRNPGQKRRSQPQPQSIFLTWTVCFEWVAPLTEPMAKKLGAQPTYLICNFVIGRCRVGNPIAVSFWIISDGHYSPACAQTVLASWLPTRTQPNVSARILASDIKSPGSPSRNRP